MELGLHLPLIDVRGEGFPRRRLVEAAEATRDAGFAAVAANDHLVFSRPWFDGLTALAAVVERTGKMAARDDHRAAGGLCRGGSRPRLSVAPGRRAEAAQPDPGAGGPAGAVRKASP
jgi:hypothetical protein